MRKNAGLTLVEVVVMIVILVVLALLLLPQMARVREAPSNYCQNNLKQWGLVHKMYANEQKDHLFPPIQVADCFLPDGTRDPEPKAVFALAPRVDAIYPEYLTDTMIALCPKDTQHDRDYLVPDDAYDFVQREPGRMDASYVYLPWLFDRLGEAHVDAAQFSRLCEAVSTLGWPPLSGEVPTQLGAALDVLFLKCLDDIRDDEGLAAQGKADRDIDLTGRKPGEGYGNKGSETIHRIREGVERVLVTDANSPAATALTQSRIPIMFDRFAVTPKATLFTHTQPQGSNVLFMDGHVEFIRYDAKAPVLPGVGRVLASLVTDN